MLVELSTRTPAELAPCSSAGSQVTLIRMQEGRADNELACAGDTRDRGYLEPPTEPCVALGIFRHPISDRELGPVGCDAA